MNIWINLINHISSVNILLWIRTPKSKRRIYLFLVKMNEDDEDVHINIVLCLFDFTYELVSWLLLFVVVVEYNKWWNVRSQRRREEVLFLESLIPFIWWWHLRRTTNSWRCFIPLLLLSLYETHFERHFIFMFTSILSKTSRKSSNSTPSSYYYYYHIDWRMI